MTSLPIRSQARRATTTAYRHADTSSIIARYRRLMAIVLATAVRSLVRAGTQEEKQATAEWLFEERDCLRAFGVTHIPNDHDTFITWVYDMAQHAKRNSLQLIDSDMKAEAQRKARERKKW